MTTEHFSTVNQVSSQSSSAAFSRQKKTEKAKKFLITIIGLVLVVGLAVTGYLYYQTKQELYYLTTQAGREEIAKRETSAVTSQLGKLTLLPEEEPVIAEILDAAFLATQSAFYQKSENGDKLVVYPQAQKAYIYSPKRHVIVNAGPLIIEPQAGAATGTNTQPAATPAAEQRRVSIEVRNGSNTVGAGTQLSESLKGRGYDVPTVADAANKEYTGTVVYVKDSAAVGAQAQTLATQVGGRVVTSLPEGEDDTDAQVLVIVGNR